MFHQNVVPLELFGIWYFFFHYMQALNVKEKIVCESFPNSFDKAGQSKNKKETNHEHNPLRRTKPDSYTWNGTVVIIMICKQQHGHSSMNRRYAQVFSYFILVHVFPLRIYFECDSS